MKPQAQSKSSLLQLILGIGITSFIVASSALALVYRQAILDWWTLRNYVPSSEIAALSEEATMTNLGQRMFYLFDPQLLGKDTFNDACSVPEESIVLGCYDGTGIYMFDIEDERLDGVEEVTAAHEMLHAVYDRLSTEELIQINTELETVLRSLKDERIIKLIEQYRQKDETSVWTEMHSIFGTEVKELTPRLEEHYAKYLADRQGVVKLAESYESKFVDLKNQVKALEQNLASRSKEIEDTENYLADLLKQIEEERSRLDSLSASGRIEEYNARVPGFNELVDTYNATIQVQNQRITEYNQLVAQAKSISLQLNDLLGSLDSNYSPITQ